MTNVQQTAVELLREWFDQDDATDPMVGGVCIFCYPRVFPANDTVDGHNVGCYYLKVREFLDKHGEG